MNFRAMGIHADLNLLDVELPQAARQCYPNEERIGFQFDVELQRAGILDDFKAVSANKRLATANGQEENSGGGKLIENHLDLGGGHFAVAGVIEIAVLATLVAPV